MYLDTNGDGVHTDADVIAPTGATTVDIWFRTDADRDGSPATCVSGAEPLDITSYEVILHATDGTITWGAFANNPPNSLPFDQISNETDFLSGYCLIPKSDPGLRRLATLALEVASGTPSIGIVPLSPLGNSHETMFGTGCDGPRLDNTLVLGWDWFDTDGARYGGWTNPPVLVQPASMTVAENATSDQLLEATDPDGSAVSFSKAAGPPYMTIVPDGASPSSAWMIHLTPGFSDSGTAIGQVVASDGVGKDFRSFKIRVLNTNRTPVFNLVSSFCVEQGDARTLRVQATDPDNDPLSFTEEGTPSFARFTEPWLGQLFLEATPPAGQDPGVTMVRITVSDGSLSVTREMELRVAELGGCSGRAPLVARPSPNPMRESGTLIFWTSVPGPLRVTLYDMRGHLARTLLNERNAPAAYHQVRIDLGRRYDGSRLPSGVYFYRIEGAEGVTSGRFVVMR
jgi:hypothetical protein